VTVALKDRLSDRAAVAPARSSRRHVTPPWWFTVPAMLLFAFVVLVPSARGVYYAFT
jgi:raffinose/stachyose/melibiose transport system permease protein